MSICVIFNDKYNRIIQNLNKIPFRFVSENDIWPFYNIIIEIKTGKL